LNFTAGKQVRQVCRTCCECSDTGLLLLPLAAAAIELPVKAPRPNY
jgi:hypothetical protein